MVIRLIVAVALARVPSLMGRRYLPGQRDGLQSRTTINLLVLRTAPARAAIARTRSVLVVATILALLTRMFRLGTTLVASTSGILILWVVVAHEATIHRSSDLAITRPTSVSALALVPSLTGPRCPPGR